MRLWQVALGLTAGAVVLVYIGKRAMAQSSATAAPTPPTTPLPSQSDGSDALYVPIYTAGEPAGQTILWTSTAEQSKAAGPRFPNYYDADNDRYVFLNQDGSYTWTRIDATGTMTGTGSGTGSPSVV